MSFFIYLSSQISTFARGFIPNLTLRIDTTDSKIDLDILKNERWLETFLENQTFLRHHSQFFVKLKSQISNFQRGFGQNLTLRVDKIDSQIDLDTLKTNVNLKPYSKTELLWGTIASFFVKQKSQISNFQRGFSQNLTSRVDTTDSKFDLDTLKNER